MTIDENGEQLTCVLCGSTDVHEEDKCFGCNALICGDHSEDPWGDHSPEDHDVPETEPQDVGHREFR